MFVCMYVCVRACVCVCVCVILFSWTSTETSASSNHIGGERSEMKHVYAPPRGDGRGGKG